MSRPKPITDQQVAEARALYEAGEVTLTDIAKRCGTHYMRLIALADKCGWVRQSSVDEINRARRIAARGLQRRAMDYLCSLIPTGDARRDEEIVIEARRMHRHLSRRAADSARAAAQG